MNSNLAYIAATATLVGAYSVTWTTSKLDPFYDFDSQSIEIDNIEHVRAASTLRGKQLVEYRHEDVRTMYDVLLKGCQISGNGPCLGHRENGKGPYKWITYAEVIERVRSIGSGLLYKGIRPINTTNIAIYSRNRPEWTISEYACYAFSLNVVSLYDSYGKDSIKYILNQAEISTIFLDNYSRAQTVAKIIHELPYLRIIVHFDDFNLSDALALQLPSTIDLVHWGRLLEVGKKNLQPSVPPMPSDIATICYTSGTTGNPKGAIITHANLISNEAAIHERLNKPHVDILGASTSDPKPVYMCYLPLAHMMERMSALRLLIDGGSMGYISGDPKTTLIDDCKELKPTNIPMVPRLLNRLYDRVMGQIGSNKLKLYLLRKAIASKEADRKKGIIARNTFYDYLIFNKIRAQLGGNVIRSATGSAPVAKDIMEFTRSVFSCPFPEGYGQTEACCAITMCHTVEPEIGHCGPPVECCLVKLVDVPEMEYYASDGKGEICAYGPSVFKGYYKDPEKTAETIDKNGWLHTGDIGMWLPNGCLKIIDRIKHIFKLSQGEYISPEKVENIYSRSLFVAQMFVDGDTLRDCIVAIVVPDEEYLLHICKQKRINGSFQELCKNQTVRDIIFKDLNELGQKSDLMSYEKIKNIHLHDELFSYENNLTTPTLKLKRIQLRSYFKKIMQNLYDELERSKTKDKPKTPTPSTT